MRKNGNIRRPLASKSLAMLLAFLLCLGTLPMMLVSAADEKIAVTGNLSDQLAGFGDQPFEIIAPNEVTLTIDEGFWLEDGSEITVQSGGKLVIDDGFWLADGSKITVQSGGKLVVENGAFLVVSGDAVVICNGIIENYHKYSDDEIWNDGIANFGEIKIENGGILINKETGYIGNGNEGVITVKSGGEIRNEDAGVDSGFDNNGLIDIKTGGKITNSTTSDIANIGTFNNAGTVDNKGSFRNEPGGILNNTGTFTNADGYWTENWNYIGGGLNNSGEINNDGTITNEGSIWNNRWEDDGVEYKGIINNKSGGTINNVGDWEVNGDDYRNNGGAIENHGDFNNAGTLTNTGVFNNSEIGVFDIEAGGIVNNNDDGVIGTNSDITINGTLTNGSKIDMWGDDVTVTFVIGSTGKLINNHEIWLSCKLNVAKHASGTFTNNGLIRTWDDAFFGTGFGGKLFLDGNGGDRGWFYVSEPVGVTVFNIAQYDRVSDDLPLKRGNETSTKWNTEWDGSGVEYAANAINVPITVTTIYAQWASSNASLKSLEYQIGGSGPWYDARRYQDWDSPNPTYVYDVELPLGTPPNAAVSLKGIPEDENATVNNGTWEKTSNLADGKRTLTLAVTSEDESWTETHNVNFTIRDYIGDSAESGFYYTLGDEPDEYWDWLDWQWEDDECTIVGELPYGISNGTKVSVTASPGDTYATVAGGNWTKTVTVAGGVVPDIVFEITSEDGKEITTYTVKLTKRTTASKDATLMYLGYQYDGQSEGKDIPLVAGKTDYSIVLPAGTSPTVAAWIWGGSNDPYATVNWGGNWIELEGGKGTAKLPVTAEDGTTKLTYTVNFSIASSGGGSGGGGSGGGGSSTPAPAPKQPSFTSSKTDPEEKFVDVMYMGLLGRNPDPEGFAYWVKQIESGAMTFTKVAYAIIFSEEVKNQNLTNEQFVTKLYNGFLGRQPDAGGLEHWTGLLTSGKMTKEAIFNAFAASEEFAGRMAALGLKV